MKKACALAGLCLITLGIGWPQAEQKKNVCADKRQDLYLLDERQSQAGPHHTRHAALFGRDANEINLAVLKGIDIVQSHAPDGGTYFTGIYAEPPESPVYYELKLFGRSLIDVPRQSSYCSGATYAAFIEALNILLAEDPRSLTAERYEAVRLQEPDGNRREDHVKFWGYWNADGFGNHFALVQYSGMGKEIPPHQCRPGDFVNISWKTGLGHSVIFLGWQKSADERRLLYWSSQKATNGYGDQSVPLESIASLKAVRLVNPQNLYHFQPESTVDIGIPGTELDVSF